jgi:hypothetical protein
MKPKRDTDKAPVLRSGRLKALWLERNEEMFDFCAAAALYSEAIEHREGPDGIIRFLAHCDVTEDEARDVLVIGRGMVGHLTVPRAQWDGARAPVAMPLIERLEARLQARELVRRNKTA